MKTWIKTFLVFAFVAGFAWLLWHLVHDQNIAILQPKGLIANEQRNLILIASALMLAVVLPVFALTTIIAWRYRATNTRARYLPNWEHNAAEEFVWWAVPCVIIIVLAGITWKTTHELDPFRPLPGDTEIIEVVALDWKWLFIYPHEGVATVNTIVFPVDKPVQFKITADAPMNSFWIPQLGGQIYAMSGMVTQLHLIAGEPGTYAGSSANLSGKGFSGMRFKAKAVSKEEFAAWIQSLKTQPALDKVTYDALAQPSSNEEPRYYGSVEQGLFDAIVQSYSSGMHMPMHQ